MHNQDSWYSIDEVCHLILGYPINPTMFDYLGAHSKEFLMSEDEINKHKESIDSLALTKFATAKTSFMSNLIQSKINNKQSRRLVPNSVKFIKGWI